MVRMKNESETMQARYNANLDDRLDDKKERKMHGVSCLEGSGENSEHRVDQHLLVQQKC